MSAKPRIAIFDAMNPRERSFMGPLAAHLEANWQVDFQQTAGNERIAATAQNAADADVLWLEWCLAPAVVASTQYDLRGKKVIVRLHSFEAIDTHFPNEVNWENVDHLVLVSNDVQDILRTRWPDLERKVDIRVIPNAIECDRFANSAPKQMTDIAWVGRIEMKKNPALFLQILAKLVAIDPAYRLHVAGVCVDLRTSRYLSHLIAQLGLGRHIGFYDYVTDMPAWFQDKGVLLSTSFYESFGMNIGEAMAAGAFPVIHNFPGANAVWPGECLFSTVDEAVALIRAAEPSKYMDFVRSRYDSALQFAAVDALLAEPNCKLSGQTALSQSNTAYPILDDVNSALILETSTVSVPVDGVNLSQPRAQRLHRRLKRRAGMMILD